MKNRLWIKVLVPVLIVAVIAAIWFARHGADGTNTPVPTEALLADVNKRAAVYGIVRPKILLPMSYKGRNDLIIAHEKMHIRRLDNLWRMLAFITVAVHWFNPLCWLFLKEFLADLELSCDERVLATLGADRTKEYASSLLESTQGTAVFASAFGGAKIRTRIENILSFKKMTWFSLMVFVSLISVIFYVLLTNAG